MTRFMDKSFSVYTSGDEEYRDRWEATFGKKPCASEAPLCVKCGHVGGHFRSCIDHVPERDSGEAFSPPRGLDVPALVRQIQALPRFKVEQMLVDEIRRRSEAARPCDARHPEKGTSCMVGVTPHNVHSDGFAAWGVPETPSSGKKKAPEPFYDDSRAGWGLWGEPRTAED